MRSMAVRHTPGISVFGSSTLAECDTRASIRLAGAPWNRGRGGVAPAGAGARPGSPPGPAPPSVTDGGPRLITRRHDAEIAGAPRAAPLSPALPPARGRARPGGLRAEGRRGLPEHPVHA